MLRTHLEEDLSLIEKYFPGARAVTMHTPFDLTEPKERQAMQADTFRAQPQTRWYGDLLWTRSA